MHTEHLLSLTVLWATIQVCQFKKLQVIQNMYSDHSGIILEINIERSLETPNTWKPNNNSQVNDLRFSLRKQQQKSKLNSK